MSEKTNKPYTVGIMQPYFMPYIGYWQHINAVDTYVLYDDVNFIKRGWINRNRILNNGKEYLFTLPLLNASQNRLICEHKFVDEADKQKLWGVVSNAYRRSPEWKNVSELMKEIILFPSMDLTEYIYNATVKVCEYLDIKTKIMLSSELDNDKTLKAQHKILDICKMLGADIYINPSGGVDLYDDILFAEGGVELKFIFPVLNEYEQQAEEFIPGLSMIDVLFSVPREELIEKLKECNIKTKDEIQED